MFQTEPLQLPKLLSWEYHCCCDDARDLAGDLGVGNVAAAGVAVAGRVQLQATVARPSGGRGTACATAHRSLPADGLMAMFSAERQKFLRRVTRAVERIDGDVRR